MQLQDWHVPRSWVVDKGFLVQSMHEHIKFRSAGSDTSQSSLVIVFGGEKLIPKILNAIVHIGSFVSDWE